MSTGCKGLDNPIGGIQLISHEESPSFAVEIANNHLGSSPNNIRTSACYHESILPSLPNDAIAPAGPVKRKSRTLLKVPDISLPPLSRYSCSLEAVPRPSMDSQKSMDSGASSAPPLTPPIATLSSVNHCFQLTDSFVSANDGDNIAQEDHLLPASLKTLRRHARFKPRTKLDLVSSHSNESKSLAVLNDEDIGRPLTPEISTEDHLQQEAVILTVDDLDSMDSAVTPRYSAGINSTDNAPASPDVSLTFTPKPTIPYSMSQLQAELPVPFPNVSPKASPMSPTVLLSSRRSSSPAPAAPPAEQGQVLQYKPRVRIPTPRTRVPSTLLKTPPLPTAQDSIPSSWNYDEEIPDKFERRTSFADAKRRGSATRSADEHGNSYRPDGFSRRSITSWASIRNLRDMFSSQSNDEASSKKRVLRKKRSQSEDLQGSRRRSGMAGSEIGFTDPWAAAAMGVSPEHLSWAEEASGGYLGVGAHSPRAGSSSAFASTNSSRSTTPFSFHGGPSSTENALSSRSRISIADVITHSPSSYSPHPSQSAALGRSASPTSILQTSRSSSVSPHPRPSSTTFLEPPSRPSSVAIRTPLPSFTDPAQAAAFRRSMDVEESLRQSESMLHFTMFGSSVGDSSKRNSLRARPPLEAARKSEDSQRTLGPRRSEQDPRRPSWVEAARGGPNGLRMSVDVRRGSITKRSMDIGGSSVENSLRGGRNDNNGLVGRVGRKISRIFVGRGS